MGDKRTIAFLAAVLVWLALGCGGENSGTGLGSDNPESATAKPTVNILRPSPCQRIHGDLVVTVEASGGTGVNRVDVTINDVVYVVFNKQPYSTVIPKEMLPSDGTYTLKAVAYDNTGNSGFGEVEIRIDLHTNLYNILVVDSQADPLGLGGQPGAVFRINPDGGSVCVLASSESFVNPSGIALQPDGNILVSDFDADLDGPGGGKGAIFKVLTGWYNRVEPFAVSSLFRSPLGMDVATDGTIYVADWDADPYSLGTGSDGTPPGAIFKIDPDTRQVTPVVSDVRLDAPIGVTIVGDGTGDLWIVDADANLRYDEHRGSIWRCSTTDSQGSLEDTAVTESDETITPFAVLPDGTGKLILVDGGDYGNGRPGKVFSIDPTAGPTASATLLISGEPLRSPGGFAPRSGGGYLIADREADTRENSYRGAILLYNPPTSLSVLYTSDLFVNPIGVIESPD